MSLPLPLIVAQPFNLTPENSGLDNSTSSSSSGGDAEQIVCVVDPYTSGAALAETVAENGYTVVSVLSDPKSDRAKLLQPAQAKNVVRHRCDLDDPDALAETMKSISNFGEVLAVMAGAEEGVELADKLAKAFKVPGNDLASSKARRDKYLMAERVRKAGVRAAAQMHVRCVEEALVFFTNVRSGLIVLKPRASMKSEDVYLCSTTAEVEEAFSKISDKTNYLNAFNDGALAQEYLDGDEYVVDAVSLGGRHKINSLWAIDRGTANGQFNVMFGARLMKSTEEVSFTIMTYAKSVLDALGVQNGASHMELKVTSDGSACLIEMGARPCGDPVTPCLNACIGQNQLQHTVDALLHPAKFEAYSDVPPEHKQTGRQSFLVSFFEGTVAGVPGRELLERLPSVQEIHMFAEPGSRIEKTVDQRTQVGFLTMWHPDPEVVERDYATIRELELTPNALYALEP